MKRRELLKSFGATGEGRARIAKSLTVALAVAAMSATAVGTEQANLTLEEGFKAPPASAKPQTWYHLMNGNITREGVTRDFEEMAKAGLGGLQMFDVGCYIPRGDLAFMSAEWFDFLAHVQNEAKRLGLEVALRDSSGWTLSGGPWITPEYAMKKVVCGRKHFKGPGRFDNVLPLPKKDNGFYADIAILAYPTPEEGAELFNWEEKIGMKRKKGELARGSREFKSSQMIARGDIINLTDKVDGTGRLVWDAPDGDWTILRVGCICNGRMLHPASTAGRGLEVDKLSAKAEELNFAAYVGVLADRLGIAKDTVGDSGITAILLDNWETGCQNWTVGLERTFEERMGYSLVPYLPLFDKCVVGSVDESERVLEDFRRLLADLIAENFTGKIVSLCHERGLKCVVESYGWGNQEDLQFGQDVDIPMAEFWTQRGATPNGINTGVDGPRFNCRIAANLAHVWGRRIAAAESFTSDPSVDRWHMTPFSIKSLGDRAYASGINRIIYHTFVHQPWSGEGHLPGMTMGRWGMHMDRTQTWWAHAAEFFKYQSRCQWMLQEGRFVADALYWRGELAPNAEKSTAPRPGDESEMEKKGYAWDYCATKAVEALKVEGGRIVAPGGVEYSVLVLPDTGVMGVKMARQIGRLVEAGAKIACPVRPVRTPGMANGTDAELKRVVDEVWAKGVMETGGAEALERLGIAGDALMDCEDGAWIHRRDKSADWYFIARDNPQAVSFEVSFRQAGRVPEIWDAETGEIHAPSAWREEGSRTIVTLDFPPSGSAFVVFREPRGNASAPQASKSNADDGAARRNVAIHGPWEVSFPVDWYTGGNAVKTLTWAELKDWTTVDDPDVKYFSGTATYKCKVEKVESLAGSGGRAVLDLGDVKDFAQVKINGKVFALLWRPPYRVDITDAISAGCLDVEIKVTNLWPNRIIGDETLYEPDCEWKAVIRLGRTEYAIKEIPEWVKAGKPSPAGRHTFATWKHWSKDDWLLPSGLLGPVVLTYVVGER